eukprot:scaffold10482_cov116-Isochrysis_galbana.AAC.11
MTHGMPSATARSMTSPATCCSRASRPRPGPTTSAVSAGNHLMMASACACGVGASAWSSPCRQPWTMSSGE